MHLRLSLPSESLTEIRSLHHSELPSFDKARGQPRTAEMHVQLTSDVECVCGPLFADYTDVSDSATQRG